MKRQLATLALSTFMLAACSQAEYEDGPASTIFDDRWIGGIEQDEPQLQIQAYDENTYVIRQSLKTSFEAPFLYLLFGEDRALLIDSGAGNIDLRAFIDKQISKREKATGKQGISLTVMHSHSHGDHIAGDDQFEGRPNTTVVGLKPEDIAAYFSLNDWPNNVGSFNLGNRIVDLIPTPGHQESHVMVFDRDTRLLFSGDVIYPGRLYFRCTGVSEYKRSIDRLVKFTENQGVKWVLGAHIELSYKPGKSYDGSDLQRTDERLLELPPTVITDVQIATAGMENAPRVEAYDNFTLFPIPENPQGKTPPDWCTN